MSARRDEGPLWSGLLPVDKPTGITSHDVVDRARRRLGLRAIGHLGTLDPGASGLLVLMVGAATRCASLWQGGAKTYEGAACFGVVTDSQDLQGRVLERREVASIDPGQVRAASDALTGSILQVPPMVSAIKHRGERLHAIARRGEEVVREPRRIAVESWVWKSFDPEAARFEVRCSGGTYVRTLVHDLGAALGTGAALASLRRLASEPFHVKQAIPWDALNQLPRERILEAYGIELDTALAGFPEVRLDDAQSVALGHGRTLALGEPAAQGAGEGSEIVLRRADGRALALATLQRGEDGGWRAKPDVVFPWAVHRAGAA